MDISEQEGYEIFLATAKLPGEDIFDSSAPIISISAEIPFDPYLQIVFICH